MGLGHWMVPILTSPCPCSAEARSWGLWQLEQALEPTTLTSRVWVTAALVAQARASLYLILGSELLTSIREAALPSTRPPLGLGLSHVPRGRLGECVATAHGGQPSNVDRLWDSLALGILTPQLLPSPYALVHNRAG